MTKPPPETVERAQNTVETIARLKECKQFTDYFLVRLRERQAALAERILRDKSLAPEARERERRVFVEYDEILNLVDQDLQLARRTLQERG